MLYMPQGGFVVICRHIQTTKLNNFLFAPKKGSNMADWMYIVGGVIFGIFTFIAGIAYRKKIAEADIGSAEEEAKRIINDALKNAQNKKKELTLEAKEEVIRLRADAEKELKDRRAEVTKQERRITQKEEALDKKTENFEAKEEKLQVKLKEIDEVKEDIVQIKKKEWETLESISGFSKEAAKEFLLKNLEDEITHEQALKIKELEARYKEEGEQKAREIVVGAMQRYSSDYVAEATVSVVPLPSDEMKGRIIGREGRNIRAIETVTGVDLIIDDTPEAITISCFDPVRREVARVALEKLITDGRIHPAKIEETVEKARRDVDHVIKQAGEAAVFETGVYGVHPEIVKTLGRLKFRTSYSQNVLKHSIEVSHIAGIIAAELGQDVNLAKRAGLLHDLGKALDRDNNEGTHVTLGAEFARKYKENPVVINSIESHHGDVEATSIIACIIQAADTVSAARPGARRENLENYVKRLQRLEELANSFDGVDRSFAIQAGREIRIMVNPEIIPDDKMVILARELAKKVEADMEYPGQIKIHMIRESRAIDFAK